MKILLMRKATGNNLIKSISLMKLRALSLVSATLEIEYGMEFYENTVDEEGNGKQPHKIHFLDETQSPVSGFCYARNLVNDAVFLRVKARKMLASPKRKGSLEIARFCQLPQVFIHVRLPTVDFGH